MSWVSGFLSDATHPFGAWSASIRGCCRLQEQETSWHFRWVQYDVITQRLDEPFVILPFFRGPPTGRGPAHHIQKRRQDWPRFSPSINPLIRDPRPGKSYSNSLTSFHTACARSRHIAMPEVSLGTNDPFVRSSRLRAGGTAVS